MIKSPRLSKRVLENEILSRRERIRRFKKVSELGEIDLKGDGERNGFISHSWQRPSRGTFPSLFPMRSASTRPSLSWVGGVGWVGLVLGSGDCRWFGINIKINNTYWTSL